MMNEYSFSKSLFLAVISSLYALTSGANAGNAALSDNDHWLFGEFTQNVPCKGDGSDLVELKVRISANQIESKIGLCKLLSVTPETGRLNANMECQFPAGPLIGEVTFTLRTNGSIAVVDRDGNYSAELYRCPR